MTILRGLTLGVLMVLTSPLHVPHVSAVGAGAVQAPGALVTTAWLAAHLKDTNLVVISSDDENRFVASHIPGARVLPHDRMLGGDHQLLPAADLARVLGQTGVTETSHVVLYGERPMATGWLYMAFASLGHGDRVSLLDGNINAWRSEGRPVAMGPSKPVPGGTLTVKPVSDVRVDAAWVRARLEQPGVRVLDVRTTREWGEGRLPGATLILWQDLYAAGDSGRFKAPQEIRALFEKAGVKKGDQVVTYCAVGMRASLMYFAATRIAGLPGRVYVGSMADWQRQQGFPIVK